MGSHSFSCRHSSLANQRFINCYEFWLHGEEEIGKLGDGISPRESGTQSRDGAELLLFVSTLKSQRTYIIIK